LHCVLKAIFFVSIRFAATSFGDSQQKTPDEIRGLNMLIKHCAKV
jgi:hypothetical protein